MVAGGPGRAPDVAADRPGDDRARARRGGRRGRSMPARQQRRLAERPGPAPLLLPGRLRRAGESAEAAVLREVREEVGVPVERLVYAGSQSWPFPGSLMLGFLAEADPEHPVRVDPTEIAHARWFTRREIGTALAGRAVDVGAGDALVLPPPSSIALFLVHRWLDGWMEPWAH
ncbi:NAD(+) diphosphatase [Micromonospora olivasterospora]|uniref:NAD(+) diphosphatase n=1 Tax=Micromonospora olivasterospora TaxID=1880 RepID=UPI00319E4799